MESSLEKFRRIDGEINELKKKLELAEEQRSNIKHFREQHFGLLSPAQKLSHNILQEIFLACLPEDRNPCMSNTDAPVLLTHICSSWRSIALSTPRLWAAIHIVLPNMQVEAASKYWKEEFDEEEKVVRSTLLIRERAVKEWLHRSGKCTLSISIYDSSTNGWFPPWIKSRVDSIQNLHLLFFQNVIIPYHNRWYELDAYVASAIFEHFHELSGLPENSLNTLRKFHITCTQSRHGGEELDNQWRNVKYFLSSNPSSVTLHGIPVKGSDISPSFCSVGWKQVTELNLKWCQSNNVDNLDLTSRILKQCNLLKSLTLDMESESILLMGRRRIEDIVLPHLHTLRISLPRFITIEEVVLIKSLNLPALKKLDFEYCDNPEIELDPQFILKSLLRATENHYSLNIYRSCMLSSSAKLLELLQHLPRLKSVALISHSVVTDRWVNRDIHIQNVPKRFDKVINDDLLSALSPLGKEYSEIICPELEELEIDYKLLTGLTERGLKEFIKGRRSDQRVADVRRISLFLDRIKATESCEEKIALGKHSAVYFRAPDNRFVAPWLGIRGYESDEIVLPKYEVYTEL